MKGEIVLHSGQPQADSVVFGGRGNEISRGRVLHTVHCRLVFQKEELLEAREGILRLRE